VKGLLAGITILPGPIVDRFDAIKEAIAKAEEEFDETKILYDAVVDDWTNLAKLYAKDPTKVKPEQFFSGIYEFAVKFDSSIVDREKRVKDLEKKRNTEKAQADLKKRKEDLQKKKQAMSIKDEKTKEKEEEEELQENLTGMLKSLVTTGQKERREVRTQAKAQVTSKPVESGETTTAAPAATETPTSSSEVNREEEKAARRALLQAKQRARRAALEAAKGGAAEGGGNPPDQE